MMRRFVQLTVLPTALLAACSKGPVPEPELRYVARTEQNLQYDVQITSEMAELWSLHRIKSSCTCVATAIHRPPLEDGQGVATVVRLEVLVGSSGDLARLFWRRRDRSFLHSTEIEVNGTDHAAAMVAEPWSARLGVEDEVSKGRVLVIGPSDIEPPILETEHAGPLDVRLGDASYDAELGRWAADYEIRLSNDEDRAVGTHEVLIRWSNADGREAVQLEVEVTG
jgi:hypothetical protein